MKIVIAESLHPAGIEILRTQAGFEVILSSPQDYERHLADADALLAARSVKVTAAQIEKAKNLRVIAFPGMGTDFVDVDAATAAGILVMNMPGESAVSVAEHTLGLMLAMARQIPQAIDSTRHGKWDAKRFLGTELRRKTLGVFGLGSIGREVVRRARAFEMRILANDPYVNSETAADLGVKLVTRDELFAQSDYITLHVALTMETLAMLNEAAFAAMKPGVRIINCARGELVDVEALRHAIESGKVAGAALDVLQTEPPEAGDRLLALDQVLATPHIGGSTEEATELVAVRLAEHVIEYFNDGVAVNAVNVPAMTEEGYRAVAPYAALAERLGTFAAYVAVGNPKLVRIVYHGSMAQQSTRMVRNAGLAGVLSRSLSRRANVVNSLKIAAERGLSWAERFERPTGHTDTIRIELETDKGTTTVEGGIVLDRPRLLAVDGVRCEAALTGHVMFLINEDVPGVLGTLGVILGKNHVNIATLSVGREETPSQAGGPSMAISIVETDEPVPDAVLQQLLEDSAIRVARKVEFQT
jgi:D-3-phosphoglycerate dehydrogenase / 2-oxoglutarate reductase